MVGVKVMTRNSQPRKLPWVWGVPADPTAATDIGGKQDSDVRVAVRAVTSTAGPDALYLWLCQLRRAPYSYDWIDNFGRQSPSVADPSLTALETGQTVMTIFTLTDHVPGRSLMLRMKPGWPTAVFGALDVGYEITPLPAAAASRLTARLWLPRPPGPLGGVRRWALAWGDLLMMRKQLHTLARLAEATEAAAQGVDA